MLGIPVLPDWILKQISEEEDKSDPDAFFTVKENKGAGAGNGCSGDNENVMVASLRENKITVLHHSK